MWCVGQGRSPARHQKGIMGLASFGLVMSRLPEGSKRNSRARTGGWAGRRAGWVGVSSMGAVPLGGRNLRGCGG